MPQRHHLQVIAIKELIPENFVFVPKADFRLKDSDILLVLGKERDIERLKAN
jgi:trk system potassium uptake protein TrkA